jgi:hypothetical protein
MSDPAETLRDGRYAVCGELGRGGSGVTLEAVDKKNGELVAIKRFEVRGARSWKDVELAEREARVLSQLSHPLLPRAIDHFEEKGVLYLVMEKIDGKPLGALESLDRAEVLRFLKDADAVLSYLHGRSPRVIHRDVKPHNFIRKQTAAGSRYVLVDLGSVRDSLKPAGGSTVVGTFGYMAPEQFQGRALPQSDVYAVGATALRMLSGQEPEALPHRGLAIDVAAVLGKKDPFTPILERLLDPNPDTRPERIAPLLVALDKPPEQPRRSKEPSKKERKKEEKRQRKAARRADRATRRAMRPTELPWGVRLMFILGIALARVAVSIALRVVVPTLLVALSVVFGRGLRRAATAVSEAGARADEAMRTANGQVQGRVAPQQRIEVDDEEDDESAGAEVEAVIDEAAEDVEAALRQRRESTRRKL